MGDDRDESPATYGVTVVGHSRLQRDGLFGFLVVAFGAALVRGLIGADSTGARLAIGIIFGGLLVLVAAGWLRVVRGQERLEVSDTDVRFISAAASRAQTLRRTDGEQLRFVSKSAGRVTFFGVYQPGSGATVLLHLFSRKAVEAALLAHTWRLS